MVVRWLQLPRGIKKIAGGMGVAAREGEESRGEGKEDWGKGVAAAKRRVAAAAPWREKLGLGFFGF